MRRALKRDGSAVYWLEPRSAWFRGSAALSRLLGVGQRIYSRDDFFSFIDECDRERVKEAIDVAAASDTSYDICYRVQRTDGTFLRVRETGHCCDTGVDRATLLLEAVVVPSSDADDAHENAFSMEHDLRGAMRREELVLHYQPVHDMRSGRVTAAEALVGWLHPVRGLMMPEYFAQRGIRSRALMRSFGGWILERACAQARDWRERGVGLKMWIKVVPDQYVDEAFLSDVCASLFRHELPPSSIGLALTERSLSLGHRESALARLRLLREMGVSIALDGFGAERSSLHCVESLPIDTIKIDRSFVRLIDVDHRDASTVRAIVALCEELGVKVIADGVDTAGQFDVLARLGCSAVQGQLTSPALEASSFLDYFDRSASDAENVRRRALRARNRES